MRICFQMVQMKTSLLLIKSSLLLMKSSLRLMKSSLLTSLLLMTLLLLCPRVQLWSQRRHRSRRLLINMAIDLRPSLVADGVRGDGNCLCRSVARLVTPANTFEEVRAELVANVEANPTIYTEFVAGNDIAAWVQKMSEDAVVRTWH